MKVIIVKNYEEASQEAELIIDGGIGGIEPSTIVNCTNGANTYKNV